MPKENETVSPGSLLLNETRLQAGNRKLSLTSLADTDDDDDKSPLPIHTEIGDAAADTYVPFSLFSSSVAMDVALNFAKATQGLEFLDFSFLGAPTNPSRMVSILDLPEISMNTANIEFVYNRFEKSEMLSRADSANNQYSNFISLPEAEQLERLTSRYTAPPRYVKISFTHSTDENFTVVESFKVLNPGGNQNSLNNKLNQLFNEVELKSVLTEGGMSSFYFSGTELVDTGADQTFHRFLKNSAYFADFYSTTATDNQTLKEKIETYMQNTTSADKNLYRNLTRDLSQYGFKVKSKLDDANIEAKTISHSMLFNNLFFDSIMKASLDNRSHLYEDEYRAYAEVTPEIKAGTIGNFYNGTISDDDYVTHINENTLYDYDVFEFADASPETYEAEQKAGVAHIGYVVEKVEIMPNGKVNILEPYKVSRIANTFIDPDVAYGASYIYKVRSLYAIEYDCIVPVQDDIDESQIIRAVFVVASGPAPLKILCVENDQPDPPSTIKFKYEPKNKGLRISWDFPRNPQGDIKGFQVFRRESIDVPFTLIKEYDFDDSIIRASRSEVASRDAYDRLYKDDKTYVLTHCLDGEFHKNSNFIYTVSCFDAHGHVANYGPQFRVTYNKRKKIIETEIISRSGALRSYPNLYLNNDVFNDSIKVSGKDRLTVFFDPEYYKIYRSEPSEGGATIESDLEFLNTTTDSSVTHKISFLNTDLIKNQTLDIKVKDKSTTGEGLGYPYLEPNNLSFTLN